MKRCAKFPLLFWLLLFSVGVLVSSRMTAQTFTVLYSFGLTNEGSAYPLAGLTLSGHTLYGTTTSTTPFSQGTVFRVETDGTGFTTLHDFTNRYPGGPWGGALVALSDRLYGTTFFFNDGGGAVFAVNTDGTAFTNLLIFSPPLLGSHLFGGLVLSSNTLYGTVFDPGIGWVFRLNTDGTGYKALHSFNADCSTCSGEPAAALILSGTTVYGTTPPGWALSNSTVFKLNIDGTGFTDLHDFSSTDGPWGRLTLSGNTLYGSTAGGGQFGGGTLFAVNIDGTDFTILHSFGDGSDGASPLAGLTLSGNTLYGATLSGGTAGEGTVFAVNTDGSGYTNLHSFMATAAGTLINADGANPWADLLLSGNTLYGTTRVGGSSGKGTVFGVSFRPELTIVQSETNIILTWLTGIAGFDYSAYALQSTTNLNSPTWTRVSTIPVVVNGQNTVTNGILQQQQFFRLGRPLE